MKEVSILKVKYYDKDVYAVIVSEDDKPSRTINMWQQEFMAKKQAEVIRNMISKGAWRE